MSAQIPNYEEEGIVEISPDAWQLATKGIKQFIIGVLEEEVEPGQVESMEKEKVGEDEVKIPPPVHQSRPVPPFRQRSTAKLSQSVRIASPGSQSISVFVRSLTGKTFCINDLRPSDTISRLRVKMGEISGTPVDDQSYVFAGKRLEDDRTLADYSISKESTIHAVLKLRGAKPVIYLFPHTKIDVKVKLSLVPQWKFSAVYPRPIKGSFKEGMSSQTAQWNCSAYPNGMITMEGSPAEIAYIFWEAETCPPNNLPDSPPTSRSPSPLPDTKPKILSPSAGFIPGTTRCSPHDSVVLPVQRVPPYLEKALLALGFHTEARTSFITYWLPSFLKHEHLALRFVPQVDFEASAPLNIEPKPDVVIRVFMLFEGLPADRLVEWKEAVERSSIDVNMWKEIVGVEEARQGGSNLFRVLEWGGMEVR
ncbi:hypothetical protein FRC01_007994 [Tulasnella sp. 417]|nr:hypothetical protein FRC01_007994 [Tulasnella sp. 417]